MPLPLLVVFGTRPEYLKLKILVQRLEETSVPFLFLQVFQHESLEVEEATKPYYASVRLPLLENTTRLTQLVSEVSKSVEPFVKQASKVIVQGDTATAFLTALCAFHNQVPVAHVEAGLRTYDLQNPFPEEAYRSMLARIATYHFCPDPSAKQNLIAEGIQSGVSVVGNPILDLVRSYKIPSRLGTCVPITIHRRENWELLHEWAREVISLCNRNPSLQFRWITHPNPALQPLIEKTLAEVGPPSNLTFQPPCSHKDLCQLLHEAFCVITDSGGIQEEASFLGKYSFVLRKTTERSAIPEEYLEKVLSPRTLVSQFEAKASTLRLLPSCTVYGTGHAADAIVQQII